MSDKAAEYLDRARSITPLIRSEAASIERQRTLTKPITDALADTGLYWLFVPEELGGVGLTPSEGLPVLEELSKADASTAWAVMASSWATGEVVGFLDQSFVKELYKDGVDGFLVAGQLLPRNPAAKVEGGYIVDGDFSFASGSDNATWIGAGIFVADEQGKLILDADGQPQARIALLPKDEVDFKANSWDVWGLAGTGSHDYRINNKFVPDSHTMQTFGAPPTRSELLYGMGIPFIGPLCHVPVVLGIATRALQLVANVAAGKARLGYTGPVGEADIFKIDFARYDALLNAARLYFYDVVRAGEETVKAGSSVTPEQIGRVQQVLAWTHEVTSDIVRFAHRWGGSKSISTGSELGRYMRDMHVATQHLLVDPIMLVNAASAILPSYQEAKA